MSPVSALELCSASGGCLGVDGIEGDGGRIAKLGRGCIEIAGVATLSTVMPSDAERAATDVLLNVDTAACASSCVVITMRAWTLTLAAATVMWTSSAIGNWSSNAIRTASTSNDDTSPATVKFIVTTGL